MPVSLLLDQKQHEHLPPSEHPISFINVCHGIVQLSPSSSSTESIDSLNSLPGTTTSSILSVSDGDGRSLRDRRGVTFFISFTRPNLGPVIPAKGHLEPRAGSALLPDLGLRNL